MAQQGREVSAIQLQAADATAAFHRWVVALLARNSICRANTIRLHKLLRDWCSIGSIQGRSQTKGAPHCHKTSWNACGRGRCLAMAATFWN